MNEEIFIVLAPSVGGTFEGNWFPTRCPWMGVWRMKGMALGERRTPLGAGSEAREPERRKSAAGCRTAPMETAGEGRAACG